MTKKFIFAFASVMGLIAALAAQAQGQVQVDEVCEKLKIKPCDEATKAEILGLVKDGLPAGVGDATAYAISKKSFNPIDLDKDLNESGYSILKFEMLEELGGRLHDLSKTGNYNKKIADRSFGDWLKRLVSAKEESFVLSLEVVEPTGAVDENGNEKINLRYYQPIYAWSAGESFRTNNEETYVKLNGTIGHYRKNSDTFTVRVVLRQAKAATISTQEIRKIIDLSSALIEPFTDIADGVAKVAGMEVASWVTDAASLAANKGTLDKIDNLLGRFEDKSVFNVSREMRYQDKGDVTEFFLDFHAPGVKHRSKGDSSSGGAGRMKLHVFLDFEASLLTRNLDGAGIGVREKPIHLAGGIVTTLEKYVLGHDASKAAWKTVGGDTHVTKSICKDTIDALSDRLRPTDVLVGLASMLYSEGAEFAARWTNDVACFGPEGSIFNQKEYAAFKFDPKLLDEGNITDDVIFGANAELKKKLPEDVSRFWRDADNYGWKYAKKGIIDDVLAFFPSDQSQITLCDETGIFTRTECSVQSRSVDAHVLLDDLYPDNLELLKVAERNRGERMVAIGCYHGDLFDTEEQSSNRFGSLAVIGNRSVEFVWGYRNRNGKPVLGDLSVSYPTEERLEKYKALYPSGCGEFKAKLWNHGEMQVAATN